ncbi:MAG: HRDC domain-containing protein, partial [Oscillospiraceae bacterium]|nr:HRDC domain-containing protein [Oscillospiraceae bacterium]
IVYCSTRKNVESVCGLLQSSGFSAEMYHAGMSDRERKRTQEDFIYDRCSVMVATNAFGMGIDKSDVSLVVHYNMPKDLESYYQEAGRAGRDGGPARCILLYSGRDVNMAEFLIENSHEDSELSPRELAEIRKRDKERLRQMTFYSTTTSCLREFILKYFGDKAPNYCGNCSNCITKFETVDVTVEAQKILSCIFRLKQRGRSSGRVLIADILLGSRNEKVVQGSLDKLSTYGLLKGVSRSRVISIIDFLVREEYIEIEPEHSTCQLTRKADEFVKSRATLLMKLPKEEAEREKPVQVFEENPELMKRLKQERFKLASEMGVPAYVVFSDATLREMSAKLPVTEEQFLKISGVGSRKAERYGKTFMGIIKEFKQER